MYVAHKWRNILAMHLKKVWSWLCGYYSAKGLEHMLPWERRQWEPRETLEWNQSLHIWTQMFRDRDGRPSMSMRSLKVKEDNTHKTNMSFTLGALLCYPFIFWIPFKCWKTSHDFAVYPLPTVPFTLAKPVWKAFLWVTHYSSQPMSPASTVLKLLSLRTAWPWKACGLTCDPQFPLSVSCQSQANIKHNQ